MPKKTKRPKPYVMHDPYFLKAKKEGYRARSVYKLIEMQERFGLIKEGMNICDLGAAPGSFIQYIKRIIKDTGQIVGVDIKPINKYTQKNINTIVHSIFEFDTLKPKVEQFIGEGKQFDLLTSDIAPNTTGHKGVDQYNSVELNIEILKFSDIFLKKGGNLILKVFKGEDFIDLIQEIKTRFKYMKEFKPHATRDRSFEIYVICEGKLN
ncbi:MAG: RlmE family RNA methyltransferase [Candidatus Gracilibacteria bacterium]